jgi:hypothetical protein
MNESLTRIAELEATLERKQKGDIFFSRLEQLQELAAITATEDEAVQKAAYSTMVRYGLQDRDMAQPVAKMLFEEAYSKNRAFNSAQLTLDICANMENISLNHLVGITMHDHPDCNPDLKLPVPDDYNFFAATTNFYYTLGNRQPNKYTELSKLVLVDSCGKLKAQGFEEDYIVRVTETIQAAVNGTKNNDLKELKFAAGVARITKESPLPFDRDLAQAVTGRLHDHLTSLPDTRETLRTAANVHLSLGDLEAFSNFGIWAYASDPQNGAGDALREFVSQYGNMTAAQTATLPPQALIREGMNAVRKLAATYKNDA